jgi:hypothetical protein
MTNLLNWILAPAAAVFLSVYVVYGFLQRRPLFSVRKTNRKFIVVAVISFVALLFSPALVMIGSHVIWSTIAFQNRTIPVPLGWVPSRDDSSFAGTVLQGRNLSFSKLPITLIGKFPRSSISFSKVRYSRSNADQYRYWKTAAADQLGIYGLKARDSRTITHGERESFCMNFGTTYWDDWQCLIFQGEFEAWYAGPSGQSEEFFDIVRRIK